VEKLMALLLLAMAIIIPACAQKDAKGTGETGPAIQAPQNKPGSQSQAATIKTASGLAYQETQLGTGAQPVMGKRVKVHYTGLLENGTKFDSSVDRGEPFIFTIGVGQVIPGWDEGVLTMKTGGKRKLIVPPQLGYGAAGAGGVIPPNATLIFDVELLDVEK
jgi:peptidylprolyl isomerase